MLPPTIPAVPKTMAIGTKPTVTKVLPQTIANVHKPSDIYMNYLSSGLKIFLYIEKIF